MTLEDAGTDYAVPTGDFIREWLDERGISQAQLAARLDVSAKHVSLLIHGTASLSYDVALGLEKVTGIEARIWNNLEALYQSDLARTRNRAALAEQSDHFRPFPIEAIRRLGWITATWADPATMTDQILRFFGVADYEAWERIWGTPQAAYRQSRAHETSKVALATWLRLGELNAELARLGTYSVETLRESLPQLRALTREPVHVFQQKLLEITASAGIAVVFVPDIPGTRCYGATRWVGNNPVVQLSLRGKKDDQFWFTLFHELGHVLLHPRNQVFIDGDASVDTDPAEAEADTFASNLLIPPSDLARMPRGRNLKAVKLFAAEIGVSPGIVVGRIHRETRDYGWGHNLKVTLKFTDATT